MPGSDILPKVTIVMPVLNEGQFIEQTLEQLVSQDYPRQCIEILVVDGGSTDDTHDIVNKMSGKHLYVKLLDNPKKRSSAGRNIGFREGQGEYFVVIDGHCYIPDDQLIKNIVKFFQKSGADCLGRPQQLDPPGLTDFQKAVAVARASKIGHSGASLIYSDFEGFISPQSNGAAYKKEVFDEVGYVDESFDAAEDLEFNYRVEKAGLKCYTGSALTVKYYPRISLSALFRQLSRYGQGRRRFIHKHPEAISFNQLIPFFFVLGLGLAIPALLSVPLKGELLSLPALLISPYFLYAGVIFFFSMYIAGQNTWGYIFVLPVIFFVIHFSLGWGFLKESIIFLRYPKAVNYERI